MRSPYNREVEALAQLDFGRFFERATLQQFASYVTLKSYTRRSVVYQAGEERNAVYGLINGHVKLAREDAVGNRVLLDILPAGSLFGEDALFASGQRERTAIAHDTVSAVRIGKAEFLKMMAEAPRLNEYVFRTVGERLIHAEDRISDLSLDGIAVRLAKVLLDLIRRYGTAQEAQKVLINLRIPHRELADLVGSTRESVTMHLNDLRRREIVEFSNRRILILNYPSLVAQAQSQLRRTDPQDDETDDE
ncbi:MAG: Crp/Fnr family transcriptional regulator [Acidobacteria bacterium]|nr:Crp/Fnr family transcriptional regulator [Acidobacteriota bacterium]